MKMGDRNVEVILGFSDGTKVARIEDLADVTDFLEQHEEYVKVVRCKDCKYFEEIMTARYRDGTTKEVQICKKRVPLKDENFYCGWGKRMDEVEE